MILDMKALLVLMVLDFAKVHAAGKDETRMRLTLPWVALSIGVLIIALYLLKRCHAPANPPQFVSREVPPGGIKPRKETA